MSGENSNSPDAAPWGSKSSGRTAEEWAAVRNAALDGQTWATACLVQIDRWYVERTRAFPGGEKIDWDALAQSSVEGYFMVMAANRLRLTLDGSPHADLLSLLPPPSHVEGKPGEGVSGATYLLHVRNAHEHDDDRRLFEPHYGFGHRWHVGSDGSMSANVGGIELPQFTNAVTAIRDELRERFELASGGFDEAMAKRLPPGVPDSGE